MLPISLQNIFPFKIFQSRNFNRIRFHFFSCFWLYFHAEEYLLVNSHFFNLQPCKYTSQSLLNKYARLVLLIVFVWIRQLSLSESSHQLSFLLSGLNIFENEHNSLSTLSTSIILLDDSYCLYEINVKEEWIFNNFYFGVWITMVAQKHVH
jgi:hypothetical protein